MLIYRLKTAFFLTFILFQSCSEVKSSKNKEVFKEQILNLIDSLETNNIGLNKYLLKDGLKKDTLMINKPDWNKELDLFKGNLISEKSLSNYILKEYIKNGLVCKEYKAKTSEIINKTYISIRKNGSFVYFVEYNLKNRLATIQYQLTLDSEKGYLIQSYQKIPYSYTTKFRIEGFFN